LPSSTCKLITFAFGRFFIPLNGFKQSGDTLPAGKSRFADVSEGKAIHNAVAAEKCLKVSLIISSNEYETKLIILRRMPYTNGALTWE